MAEIIHLITVEDHCPAISLAHTVKVVNVFCVSVWELKNSQTYRFDQNNYFYSFAYVDQTEHVWFMKFDFLVFSTGAVRLR